MIDQLTPYYLVGAVGMGVGTLVFGYAFVTEPRNRTFYGLLTAIPAIAFVSYLLMAGRVGVMTGSSGAPLDPIRYIDWALSTPLIVAYLGLLSGISRRYLAVLMALDVVVMVTGFVGALLPGLYGWAAFGVGMVAYLPLVHGLTVGVRKAVADRPSPVRELFRKLRNLTLVIWTFYPVLWILAPTGVGVIDYPTGVMLIAYADLIAKVGFGFIVMNSRRSMSELPQVGALGSASLSGGE